MKYCLKLYSLLPWVAIRSFALTVFALSLMELVMPGCKKEDQGPPPHDGYIGEHYGGGIVFFVDDTRQHGLIAAEPDQGDFSWSFAGVVLTNATSTTDGARNTQKIISAQGRYAYSTYAALHCTYNYGGGFDDWFLPSKDQLDMLYSQRSVVGGFADELYWSSTEYDLGEAWVQNFANGDQFTHDKLDFHVNTRAIRAF